MHVYKIFNIFTGITSNGEYKDFCNCLASCVNQIWLHKYFKIIPTGIFSFIYFEKKKFYGSFHVNLKYVFILDWLVSRRICPSDWQKDILIVRKNINNAIQDMPAIDEIAQMLAGTCMYQKMYLFEYVLKKNSFGG